MENDVVAVSLTIVIYKNVTESYIDKNWKLEDWIDKTEN